MSKRSIFYIFLVLLLTSTLYYYLGNRNTSSFHVSDTGTITSVELRSKSITIKNSNQQEMVLVCNSKTLYLDDQEKTIAFSSLIPTLTVRYEGIRTKQNTDLVIILKEIQITSSPDVIILSPAETETIHSFPITLRGYLRMDSEQTYTLSINGTNVGKIEVLKQEQSTLYNLFELPITLTRKMVQSMDPLLEISIQKQGSSKPFVRTYPLKWVKKVELYFGNSQKDPLSEDCSAVFPVEREILMLADPSDILHLLLQGPSAAEKEKGFYSSLPFGASLNHVEMKDKQITVDFRRLHAGGSCQIDAILSEVSQTLISAYPGSTVTVTEEGWPLSP